MLLVGAYYFYDYDDVTHVVTNAAVLVVWHLILESFRNISSKKKPNEKTYIFFLRANIEIGRAYLPKLNVTYI